MQGNMGFQSIWNVRWQFFLFFSSFKRVDSPYERDLIYSFSLRPCFGCSFHTHGPKANVWRKVKESEVAVFIWIETRAWIGWCLTRIWTAACKTNRNGLEFPFGMWRGLCGPTTMTMTWFSWSYCRNRNSLNDPNLFLGNCNEIGDAAMKFIGHLPSIEIIRDYLYASLPIVWATFGFRSHGWGTKKMSYF